MTEPLRLLPPRVPFVDLETGYVSRDWYMFLQQLYARVGGAIAPSNDDLAADLFEDAGNGELVAQVFSLGDEFWQQPLFEQLRIPDDQSAELADMRAHVAELTKSLEGAQSCISQLQSQLAELSKELDAINQAIVQP